jgi:hypothetical protein
VSNRFTALVLLALNVAFFVWGVNNAEVLWQWAIVVLSLLAIILSAYVLWERV